MGIIDKFDDTVRLNLRRFGLTALPLFSVTVALTAPQEVALLCGTSCSALALLGSRPARIRPTVGREMYRTVQYLLANFAPFAENSTIKPCLLFAMQLMGLMHGARDLDERRRERCCNMPMIGSMVPCEMTMLLSTHRITNFTGWWWSTTYVIWPRH